MIKNHKEKQEGKSLGIPCRETKVKGEGPDLLMLSTDGRYSYRVLATITNERISFLCHFWEGLIVIHWTLQPLVYLPSLRI